MVSEDANIIIMLTFYLKINTIAKNRNKNLDTLEYDKTLFSLILINNFNYLLYLS